MIRETEIKDVIGDPLGALTEEYISLRKEVGSRNVPGGGIDRKYK